MGKGVLCGNLSSRMLRRPKSGLCIPLNFMGDAKSCIVSTSFFDPTQEEVILVKLELIQEVKCSWSCVWGRSLCQSFGSHGVEAWMWEIWWWWPYGWLIAFTWSQVAIWNEGTGVQVSRHLCSQSCSQRKTILQKDLLLQSQCNALSSCVLNPYPANCRVFLLYKWLLNLQAISKTGAWVSLNTTSDSSKGTVVFLLFILTSLFWSVTYSENVCLL